MRNTIHLVVLVAASAATVWSQEINWVNQLGRLAQDPTAVRETMGKVDPGQKQEFVARLLRAVGTIPLSLEEKNKRVARIAHEVVAGSTDADEKKDTLVTVFSKVDPTFLSGVSDTLAIGLDMKRNELSPDAFLDIATNVITRVDQQTVGDPDALVRVTMTIATFLRAAGNDLEFEPLFLACLADTGFAGVVKNVVGSAAKGDYEPMLQANGYDRTGPGNWFVGEVQTPGNPLLPLWGTQSGWIGTDGGFGAGIGGTGLGGAGALPTPAEPYAGQRITRTRWTQCLRCQPDPDPDPDPDPQPDPDTESNTPLENGGQ